MSTPKDFWGRCPVCRARLKDDTECPRCGMDFTMALGVAEQAEDLCRQVSRALKDGLHEQALLDAFRAARMHATPESIRALAVAALANGRFGLAVSLWQGLRDAENGIERP